MKESDVTASQPLFFGLTCSENDPEKAAEVISEPNQLRLLIGYRRLLLAQAEDTFAWLKHNISLNCAKGSACRTSLTEFSLPRHRPET
jgi:hypothetical protein